MFVENAVNEIDSNGYNVGVISHGWLAPRHPDPDRMRGADLKAMAEVREVGRRAFLFWDFLSLFQAVRSASEEKSFKIALSSMQVV